MSREKVQSDSWEGTKCPRYEVSKVTSYLEKIQSVQGTKWQRYEVSWHHILIIINVCLIYPYCEICPTAPCPCFSANVSSSSMQTFLQQRWRQCKGTKLSQHTVQNKSTFTITFIGLSASFLAKLHIINKNLFGKRNMSDSRLVVVLLSKLT